MDCAAKASCAAQSTESVERRRLSSTAGRVHHASPSQTVSEFPRIHSPLFILPGSLLLFDIFRLTVILLPHRYVEKKIYFHVLSATVKKKNIFRCSKKGTGKYRGRCEKHKYFSQQPRMKSIFMGFVSIINSNESRL